MAFTLLRSPALPGVVMMVPWGERGPVKGDASRPHLSHGRGRQGGKKVREENWGGFLGGADMKG